MIRTTLEAITDRTYSDREWHILALLQSFRGKHIPLKYLGKCLGMKPGLIGKVLREFEASDTIRTLKPEREPGTKRFKEAYRLLTIERHTVAGAKRWVQIPDHVAGVYGHNKATSTRLRIHALQMDKQFTQGLDIDAKWLPYIRPRTVAAVLGCSEKTVRSTYAIQNKNGWLAPKEPLPRRQRITLPNGKQQRVVSATHAQINYARLRMDQVGLEGTMRVAHELIDDDGLLNIDKFIEALGEIVVARAIEDDWQREWDRLGPEAQAAYVGADLAPSRG